MSKRHDTSFPCKNLTKEWQRGIKKCGGSSAIQYSPIKPVVCNLKSGDKSFFGKDKFLNSYTLAVMLAEENHYINTLQSMYEFLKNDSDVNTMLNSSRSKNDWLSQLVDVIKIGEGGFGSVYRAKNKVTNMYVAIKHIKPKCDDTKQHLEAVKKIINEKNILMSSGNFPFLVNLIGAERDNKGASFWLIMEYCPVDLEGLLKHLDVDQPDVARKLFMKGKIVPENLLRKYFKVVDVGLMKMFIVYFFEMLCALDFLASRHLVHCDIKSANILVAMSGHCKLADYGEAHRFRWVNSDTRLELLHSFDEDTEKERYQYAGNDAAVDPESIVKFLQDRDPENFDEFVKEYNLEEEVKNPFFGEQNFLSDVYAMGCTFIDWIFFGFNPLVIPFYDMEFINSFPEFLKIEGEYPKLGIIYREEYFDLCLTKQLHKMRPYKHAPQFFDFVLDTLRPRHQRILNYSKPIKVFYLEQIADERCLDMDKVEAIDYFQGSNICRTNVTSIDMGETIEAALKAISDNKKNIADCKGIQEDNDEDERLLPTNSILYNKQN